MSNLHNYIIISNEMMIFLFFPRVNVSALFLTKAINKVLAKMAVSTGLKFCFLLSNKDKIYERYIL